MADRSLGAAVLRTRLDQSGLRTGLTTLRRDTEQTLTTIEQRLDQTGRRLQRLGTGLTVGLTVPIAALGTAVVRAASDAEETESKFRTVFSSIGTQAAAAATRLSESFGQSDRAAQALLANTGDLLTGFGFQQDAALDLSAAVNELAIDLASFTNFQGGAEAASQALTSALLGEREAAKSLGIVITEDVVQAKVDELRASGELVGATEQQAKAYATLQIAQEQSKNAIGDFARTQDSFANQTRILASNVDDLRVALGEGILPVVTPIIGRLADTVEVLADMDTRMRNVTVAVAGLAAAAGPLAIALGSVARGLAAIRVAILPLAGPAGLIIGLGAAVATLATVMVRQGERSVRTSETAVKDLVSQYDRYRSALTTTTEAERQAARDRLQTLKDELQERLRAVQEIIQGQIEETQGFIDSPLGQFLLPGFIQFEGGANQELYDQLGDLRNTIADINVDLDSLDRGVNITPEIVPTPDVPGATPADPTGLLSLEDGIDVPIRVQATPDQIIARLDPLNQQRLAAQQGGGPGQTAPLPVTFDASAADFVAGRIVAQAQIAGSPPLQGRLQTQGGPGAPQSAEDIQAFNDQVAASAQRQAEAAGTLTDFERETRGAVDGMLAFNQRLAEIESVRVVVDRIRTQAAIAASPALQGRLQTQGGPGAPQSQEELDAFNVEVEAAAERQAQAAGALTTFEQEARAASTALVGLTRGQDAVLGVLGRAQAATIRGDRVAGGYGAAGDLSGRDVNFAPRPFEGEEFVDRGREGVAPVFDAEVFTRKFDAAGERFRQEAVDGGIQTAEEIIGAGQGFVSAIDQFQSGNIGGGIAGLAGAAGGIANFFAPGIGSLISGAGSLLGGVVNLFSGDDDQGRDEIRREQASRGRSVPAVNINFEVQQENVYQGGPDQPAVEQAFLRQTRQLVEEILERSGLLETVRDLGAAT